MKRSCSGENATSGDGSTSVPQVSHIVSSAWGEVAGSTPTHSTRIASPRSASRASRERKDENTRRP